MPSHTRKGNQAGNGQQPQSLGAPQTRAEPTRLPDRPAGVDESPEEADGGKWTDVVKKKNRVQTTEGTRVIRRGTTAMASSQKFSAEKKKKLTFFSSNWDKHVQVGDVVSFFKDAHNLDAIVEPIDTRAPRHKCFKIQMSVENIDLVYEDSFWPEEIIFIKYHFRDTGSISGGQIDSKRDKNIDNNSETLRKTYDNKNGNVKNSNINKNINDSTVSKNSTHEITLSSTVLQLGEVPLNKNDMLNNSIEKDHEDEYETSHSDNEG